MPTWGDPTRTLTSGQQGFEYQPDGQQSMQDRVSALEQQIKQLFDAKAVDDLRTTPFLLSDRVTVRSDITTPTDANFVRPIDGLWVYTTSNKRLWLRALGLWGYVTFT